MMTIRQALELDLSAELKDELRQHDPDKFLGRTEDDKLFVIDHTPHNHHLLAHSQGVDEVEEFGKCIVCGGQDPCSHDFNYGGFWNAPPTDNTLGKPWRLPDPEPKSLAEAVEFYTPQASWGTIEAAVIDTGKGLFVTDLTGSLEGTIDELGEMCLARWPGHCHEGFSSLIGQLYAMRLDRTIGPAFLLRKHDNMVSKIPILIKPDKPWP